MIKKNQNIDAQIGGLMHDAVAIVVAELNNLEKLNMGSKDYDARKYIKVWLDILYEIAENKKKDLTEIKPVSEKQANDQSEEFNKNVEQVVGEGREKQAEAKQ